MNQVKFKSFEAMVLYFNGTYKLPISPVPSTHAESLWQKEKFPEADLFSEKETARKRMNDFFGSILQKELNEYKDILANLEDPEKGYQSDLDFLTDLADLLGDIMVYCASEMLRYGIPIQDTLAIIMDSNFSKLDAQGNPIYDEDGKVCKGPNYWKPEPMIKQMLLDLQLQAARTGKGNHDEH